MSVDVELVLAGKIGFAAHQNAVPVLRELRLTHSGQEPLVDLSLTVTAEPAFVVPRTWHLERLDPKGTLYLDDRDLEHLGVGKVADDHRKVVQLGDLGRAPAAFAGDDLEKPAAIRVRADDERLQDAARADGVRELLQKLGLEVAARLVGVGDQLLDGDALGLRRGAVGRQRDIGHQGG